MIHIFPNSALRDMNSVHTDGTIEKLSLEIQNDGVLYCSQCIFLLLLKQKWFRNCLIMSETLLFYVFIV